MSYTSYASRIGAPLYFYRVRDEDVNSERDVFNVIANKFNINEQLLMKENPIPQPQTGDIIVVNFKKS